MGVKIHIAGDVTEEICELDDVNMLSWGGTWRRMKTKEVPTILDELLREFNSTMMHEVLQRFGISTLNFQGFLT